MIRLFIGACHLPIWAESTALCACQITVCIGNYKEAILHRHFSTFVMRYSIWINVICHMCDAVVICVIPALDLQIRTHAISSFKNGDIVWVLKYDWQLLNCSIIAVREKGNAVFCSELRAWAHILKGKKKPLRINNLSHFIRQFSSHLKLLWWQGGILRQLMTYAKPTHCKLHSS